MPKKGTGNKVSKNSKHKSGSKISGSAVEKELLKQTPSQDDKTATSSEESSTDKEPDDQPKKRYLPNIIITGTPGCGKSTLSLSLSKVDELKTTLFDISEFAKKEDIFESYDEARKSHVIDEEELLNRLEAPLRKGGCIIDWHCNDIFPERLIDLVIVLQCGTSSLHDRLKARNYHESKIQENIDAEIMSVVLEDALESYDKRIVVALPSENKEQIEGNLDKIIVWCKQWMKDNKSGVTNEISEFYKDRDLPQDFDSDEES